MAALCGVTRAGVRNASGTAGRRARIAVVGAGWWSQGWHLPHLHRNPKVDLVAVVDPTAQPTSPINPNLESLVDLSKKYGIASFETLDDLLAPASGVTGLDGVVVGTNHATHQKIATRAMEAGLNVFCEKPMTVDVEEAKHLAATAAASNAVFMVNNTANFRPGTKKIREMVLAGDIGDIRHGSVVFHTPLGWIFHDETNKSWNEPTGNMVGNGFGWGQLAHPFAWFFMVSGLTPAKVFSFNGLSPTSKADVYDAVSILCTNGATISVSGVASIPGDNKLIENRFVGTEGVLSYCGVDEDKGKTSGGSADSNGPSGQLVLSRFDGRNETIPGFEFENTDMDGDGPESLQAFIDACLGQPYFAGADAQVGLKAVASIDALYRSSLSGKAEDTGL